MEDIDAIKLTELALLYKLDKIIEDNKLPKELHALKTEFTKESVTFDRCKELFNEKTCKELFNKCLNEEVIEAVNGKIQAEHKDLFDKLDKYLPSYSKKFKICYYLFYSRDIKSQAIEIPIVPIVPIKAEAKVALEAGVNPVIAGSEESKGYPQSGQIDLNPPIAEAKKPYMGKAGKALYKGLGKASSGAASGTIAAASGAARLAGKALSGASSKREEKAIPPTESKSDDVNENSDAELDEITKNLLIKYIENIGEEKNDENTIPQNQTTTTATNI